MIYDRLISGFHFFSRLGDAYTEMLDMELIDSDIEIELGDRRRIGPKDVGKNLIGMKVISKET